MQLFKMLRRTAIEQCHDTPALGIAQIKLIKIKYVHKHIFLFSPQRDRLLVYHHL